VVGSILPGLRQEYIGRNAGLGQRGLDSIRVLPASLVLVGHDDDVCTPKTCGVFVAPLPGPARIAAGHSASPLDGVNVLFAFHHVDGAALTSSLDDGGEPVQDAPRPVEVPHPAAPIGTALPEVLRPEPTHLEQDGSLLVGVGVALHDGGALAMLEQVPHFESERGDDVGGFASREAREESSVVPAPSY
jgi:hypothetical protein